MSLYLIFLLCLLFFCIYFDNYIFNKKLYFEISLIKNIRTHCGMKYLLNIPVETANEGRVIKDDN